MKLKNLSVNVMFRIYYKVNSTAKKIKPELNDSEEKLLKKKVAELKVIYRKSKIFYIARLISFILIYISLISAVIGNYFLIEQLTNILGIVSGIIGTSFLAIIILVCQKMISIYINEAQLISNYVVALEVKNLK